MKKIVMMFVMGVVVWGIGNSWASVYTVNEFPICTNSSTASPPAISGNLVIWEDSRNRDSGLYSIYGYDLTTNTESLIYSNDKEIEDLRIDGDIIVWRDHRNDSADVYGNIIVWEDDGYGNHDIYGYNLSTETEFAISTNSFRQRRPSISGNTVIWEDNRNGNEDIYGFDLVTQEELPICTNISDQIMPQISDDTVVWWDFRNFGTGTNTDYDIYGYDLTSNTELVIGMNEHGDIYPSIDGNIVVWQGHNDIYGYDLDTQIQFTISDTFDSQRFARVSGNTVVWLDNRNGNWDIYGARIVGPTVQVTLDIKPTSCPNPLNTTSQGVLPIAILGSEQFDVSTIVPTSVRLAGIEPIRDSLEDVATLLTDPNECECTTNGPDGFMDLTLKFKTQQIVEALGEVNTGDILTLTLTGVLNDETPIEGADCVVIVGRHKPINKADVNEDGLVNAVDMAIVAENWLESSIV